MEFLKNFIDRRKKKFSKFTAGFTREFPRKIFFSFLIYDFYVFGMMLEQFFLVAKWLSKRINKKEEKKKKG